MGINETRPDPLQTDQTSDSNLTSNSIIYGDLFPASPIFDERQALYFLGELFGNSKGTGDIVLAFLYAGQTAIQRHINGKGLDSSLISSMMSQNRNVYVAMARFDPARPNHKTHSRDSRKKADAVVIPGTWQDFDIKDICFHSPEEIDRVLEALPQATLSVASGSGGRHVYWLYNTPETDVAYATRVNIGWRKHVEDVATEILGRAVRLDHVQDASRVMRVPGTARFKKGQPVTQVSIVSHSGPRYAISEITQIAPPPQEVTRVAVGALDLSVTADQVLQYVAAAVQGEAKDLAEVSDGRNNALNKAAYKLGTLGAHSILDSDVAYDALLEACTVNGLLNDDGQAQFDATFESGWTAGIRMPRDLSGVRMLQSDTKMHKLQDDGNALRFVDQHRDRVRWVLDEGDGVWRLCKNGVWEAVSSVEILELARQTARSIADEAAAITNDDNLKAQVSRWAAASLGAARIKSMIDLARGDSRIWARAEEFDQHPYFLACENGIIDLRTGELKPHNPNLLIGRRVPRVYDPHVKAPTWEALVARAVQAANDSGETLEYLHRFMGYSLVGQNLAQVLMIALGPESCGKSKMMEIARDVVGPQLGHTSRPALLVKAQRDKHHASETYSLRHKRLVVISEMDADMNLDESHVKDLTGSNRFTIRRLYGAEEQSTAVTWTIMVSTNHAPNVQKWDGAIARRLIVIPFGPTLEPHERDIHIADKILESEASGVLTWLVQGAVAWWHAYQEEMRIGGEATGLSRRSAAIEFQTMQYAVDNDHEGNFISERLIPSPGKKTPLSTVWDAYKRYAGLAERAAGKSSFYKRIAQRGGYQKDSRYFYDVSLVHETIDWEAGGL